MAGEKLASFRGYPENEMIERARALATEQQLGNVTFNGTTTLPASVMGSGRYGRNGDTSYQAIWRFST